ncbi:MAG: hypothetical protein LC792_21750, partial [Actinobacteria bacterium]|nr:hypothetical protein [Actinomycetota bacterium]
MSALRRAVGVAVVAVAVVAGTPSGAVEIPGLTPTAPPPAETQATGEALVGTFTISQGSCASSPAKGSWFRMIQPNGNAASGPYVQNADSTCSDKAFTAMAPGSDGGLVTGAHQPQPSPEFDGAGNGLASRITKPTRFYGVDFATATNPVDPQTGRKAGPPSVTVDGAGRLTGDLRAFAAAWNRQHFNQGSPKPDGSRPGTTAGPTVTYNASSGAFTLE